MYKYTDVSYLKVAFNNKHDVQSNTNRLYMYKDDTHIRM